MRTRASSEKKTNKVERKERKKEGGGKDRLVRQTLMKSAGGSSPRIYRLTQRRRMKSGSAKKQTLKYCILYSQRKKPGADRPKGENGFAANRVAVSDWKGWNA